MLEAQSDSSANHHTIATRHTQASHPAILHHLQLKIKDLVMFKWLDWEERLMTQEIAVALLEQKVMHQVNESCSLRLYLHGKQNGAPLGLYYNATHVWLG